MGKAAKEQYVVEILNRHIDIMSVDIGIKGRKGQYNRSKNRWAFSCPFCKEGKSWGRMNRLIYDIDRDFIHCYNGGCTVNGYPERYLANLEQVKEVDIVKEYLSISEVKDEFKNRKHDSTQNMVPINLPNNIIDVFSLKTYTPKNTEEAQIIQIAVNFLKRRKIIEAPYAIDELYLIVDKNVPFYGRLIVPFKVGGTVIYWQGRAIKNTIKPKYMSSENLCHNVNPIFGMDNLPSEPEYVFITEGAFDAIFAINTVAIAHDFPSFDTINYLIKKFNLDRFPLPRSHIVIVPDNPMIDSTGLENYIKAIDEGLSVFTWLNDENLHAHKDFNDYIQAGGDLLKFTDMNYMKSMLLSGFAAKMALNPNITPQYLLSAQE